MNKFLTLLIIIMIPSLGLIAQNANENESVALTTRGQNVPYTWDTTMVDLGEIPHKTRKTAEYKLNNTGNQPLFIVYGQTSCGCAHLEYSEAPILPGKSTIVTVNYHGTDLGEFLKTITIVTNADTDRTILQIKGNVVKD